VPKSRETFARQQGFKETPRFRADAESVLQDLVARPGGGRPYPAADGGSARRISLMLECQRLAVSEVGEVTMVHFHDRKITEDRRAEQVGRELYHLVEGEGPKKLLLNLSSVDFLSSAALGKLITLDKKTRARGGVLKLSNICPELLQILTVTRLDRLFDIEKDETAALAAFC
jgi:anti-sigma B factor antagonist